ncbi:MAG: peptide ABC transporter substrate-binding protein [Patescibacteria group bacterium]
MNEAVSAFSPIENVLFWLFVTCFAVSALVLLYRANDLFMVDIPAAGGELTEGIIGTPHLANPLFATSEADKDIVSLVYAGLMKVESDGRLVPELAKSYTISDDGKTYTFNLRDGITFHDGEPITADDVEFTIRKAIDPAVKSPKRANWEGVTVSVPNPEQIVFTLRQPYAAFLESTTLGILPKHLWKVLDPEQFAFSQYNAQPIGAGPYKIDVVNKNNLGVPTQYSFIPFEQYTLGSPLISKLNFTFYPSEEAAIEGYGIGEIEALNTLTPQKADSVKKPGSTILQAALPRIFGVFFNQNQNALFTQKEVRAALEMAVDRHEIIANVLNGYGSPLAGPVPTNFMIDDSSASTAIATIAASTTARIEDAKKLLAKNGWKLGDNGVMQKTVKKTTSTLTFTLSTANSEDLIKTAQLLKKQWEMIGAKVDVRSSEEGEFKQTVLRPRKYESVLFGEAVGRNLDLYAFWHSSQRNDPGVNIALYTNAKADKLLEQARSESESTKRAKLINQFTQELTKDQPAIFLYSPSFLYLLPDKVKNVELTKTSDPSERFAEIERWFINTERVWDINIFTNKTSVINKQ